MPMFSSPQPRAHQPMELPKVNREAQAESPEPQRNFKPPPPGGGWGWSPIYGWGYFPDGGGKPRPPGGIAPPDTEQPPEPEEPPPEGEIDGMVMVFEDKFNSNKLDQEKWWTRYVYSGPDGEGTLDYLNDEWERYRESGNHVIHANTIALTALPPLPGPPATSAGDKWYPSGMIRSKSLFDLASGDPYYFECKGKVPAGQATWGAFWLYADAKTPTDVNSVFWPPEIDIMEIVNNGVEDTTKMLGARCQVHDWTNNPQEYALTQVAENFNTEFSVWYAPFDFADDYHLFGLLYERPNFTIYCDRQPIVSGVYDWVWDDRRDAPPAGVLCNLAIGGSWAGRHGVDDSAFPQSLDVEYIRVYSNTTKELPQSQIGKDYEIS